MRNVTDIIGELVGRISAELTAERIEIIGTTTKFWTCAKKWAAVGGKLGGLLIIEVGANYIIVEGALAGLVYSLDAPKYKHGTVIHVNTENLAADSNYQEPYPMIYFPETIGDVERYDSKMDIREMTASIRLIFAKRFQTDWTTDEYTALCINPMLALYAEFKKIVEKDGYISPLRNIRWKEKYYPILGSYVQDKGYTNLWFDDKVGGVVVDFTIDVLKGFECLCCGCDIPELPAEVSNWVDNENNQFVDNENDNIVIIN